MDQLIERCCGLDVHRDTVVACVRGPGPNGRRQHEVRTFGTTAVELLALRDWLEAHAVTDVAMESTGVYWKPVFYVLEEAFTCLLVNAAHIKQVPGRKTDVKDCMWIAQCLEHGLLRGSFVPPAPIRELRDLTRHRKVLIQERTRAANRLHKLLEDAGIKLASVATNILGVSGRAMLAALVHGTTDPAVLADLARGKLRKKLPALRQALAGRFRPHHAFLVSQLLAAAGPFRRAADAAGHDPRDQYAHRRGDHRRARGGYELFPERSASGQLGGNLSGQQRERGEASIGEDPERQPVVADDPHRSRRGGDPHQGQCAGGPVPARDAASRAQESRGGGGARDAPGGLPSPGRGHDVP